MKITPYGKNAKKHPEKQIKALARAIKAFGFSPALEVDKDGVIISGHGRWLAAQLLGWESLHVAPRSPKGVEKVPYIVLDDLTAVEVKQKRLADNKLAETDTDMILALEELKEIELEGGDITLTGYDTDLLIEPDEKDDEVPETPIEPKSKLGDLYELGQHRVLCGDSTKIEDVERLMDGKKADMVFTDPPYGMFLDTDFSQIVGSAKSIDFKGKLLGNKYNKVIGDNEDFTPDLINSIFDNFDYCKEVFIWGADYFIDLIPNYGKDGCLLVWNKRSSDEQQKGIGNCFEMFWSKQKHKKYVFSFEWFGFLSKDAPQEARNRVHPTMKPIGLIEKIWLWYKSPMNIVADIYLGSGSTLIASEKTGRICYGMELDSKYVDVIVQRYVDYTGNTKIKKNGVEMKWDKNEEIV